MSNLFKKTSSNWVRYDKYEWKEDNAGILYITPAPDTKRFLYNPLKDSEQLVLKAVNLGLMCMMFSFMITDEKSTLRVCKHCGNAFIAGRPNSVFCSGRCKNRYNVYKSRAKDKDNTDA